MEDLFVQIASIESWLREKPHVGQVEKSEMVSRLRELNDKLNEQQKEKIKKGLILLNQGKSPLKDKIQ